MKRAIITNDGALIKLEHEGIIQKDSNGTMKLFNSAKMRTYLKSQGYKIITCNTDLFNLL